MSGFTTPVVRIETADFDRRGRQISSAGRTAALLEERRAEIEAGIASAADIVRTSMDTVEEKNGWRVSSVEATFGITLSAEAEASFEVTMVIERA